MPNENSPVEMIPSQSEMVLAKESGRKLAALLGEAVTGSAAQSSADVIKLTITLDGEHKIVSIPASVLRMLNSILAQMAQGNTVTLVPGQCEMTTRQAAHYLNVSRPFLVSILKKGKLPYRQVGAHRRVLFSDLERYKQEMNRDRDSALEELVKEGQDLNLGY